MTEKEGPDQSIELTIAKVFKLKLPESITNAVFGSKAATAETLRALSRGALDKISKGEALHPDEHLAHELVMAPLRRKAARLLATQARAAEIIANEPKLLPGRIDGQPTPEPTAPGEAWKERYAEGASLDAEPDVREMWARILAGEATVPGSFSFKTLSVLKDVDTEMAQKFVRLLAFSVNGVGVTTRNAIGQHYDAQDLLHADFLRLDELGLLNFSALSGLAPRDFTCQGLWFVVKQEPGRVDVHTLTRAGLELARVSDRKHNLDALRAVGNYLAIENGGKLAVVPEGTEGRPWAPDEIVLDTQSGAYRFASP